MSSCVRFFVNSNRNFINIDWRCLMQKDSSSPGRSKVLQTSCMVRATPWSPWKALEFNIWFQGRLKSPWKEEFFVKVLENDGNSLNFSGMGNSKGYIKNWAHISNLQNDFAKNFCSTCTFACSVKSDLRTLYSGISFSIWSNGPQRPMPSSMCCLGLRGFVSSFAFGVKNAW